MAEVSSGGEWEFKQKKQGNSLDKEHVGRAGLDSG